MATGGDGGDGGAGQVELLPSNREAAEDQTPVHDRGIEAGWVTPAHPHPHPHPQARIAGLDAWPARPRPVLRDKTRLAGLAAALGQRHASRIAGRLELPAEDGSYAPLPDWLPARLTQALSHRGIDQLYSHQRQAVDAIEAGRHVVIATPTASGKTLCYTLPVARAVLESDARALYLFPTKALAQDQVAELLELNKAGDLGLRAATFDGDTPADARRSIRLNGQIVVSNPDMLHQALLPQHPAWAQFFENLRFVVIDEIHGYRGVFGSHVANVLRRLKRIAAFYGSQPQFIMASATIGNAREHAEALIEAPVSLIEKSGAPVGPRTIWLWNPPIVNRDLGLRASARSQAVKLARHAIRAKLATLVFCPSRLLVEVITKYLKDVFDNDPRRAARIRAYRGGYLPTERRAAEQAMRAGRVDGIVSTSALELGVDIGALDVVVVCGYPGSIAQTWQRFGRAGRRQQPSLAVLVASSQPLDQYLVKHPEFFFGASPEHARIAADQPLVLLDHIRCAAFELPFQASEAFGPIDPEPWLDVLAEAGVVHRDGDRFDWIDDSYPAGAVSLRGVADGNFVVVDATRGGRDILAEVDYASAALTLYEGAIYMIQAQTFQVERLDWAGRKAFVRTVSVDYYTDAIDYTRLKPLEQFDGGPSGVGDEGHGEVHVVRRVSGYKKVRYYSHENIGYGQVALPDQELHTTALWWRLSQAALEQLFSSRQAALDGLQGAAHALHLVAMVAVMASPRDLIRAVGSGDADGCLPLDPRAPDGRASAFAEGIAGARRSAPTIYLYDNQPGGSGLTEALWSRRAELLDRAKSLIEGCDCERGCPACVGPVAAAEAPDPEPLNRLAQRVLNAFAGPTERAPLDRSIAIPDAAD